MPPAAKDSLKAPLQTRQPFKAWFVALAVLLELARLPFWLVLYTLPVGRPCAQWTYRQALAIRLVKSAMQIVAEIRFKTRISLAPGKEAERFVVIQPQDGELYADIAAADADTQPGRVGAVWLPEKLRAAQVQAAEVVLHFHGGAYVFGDGRDAGMRYPAMQFIRHGRATHVLSPDYRLSSSDAGAGRFPAALQDAITSYLFLLNKVGVPAQRITLSGDSAGGNLALALLRYIAEQENSLALPWPGCVWLWSPWVDVAACLNPKAFSSTERYKTDLVGANFGYWGATTLGPECIVSGPYLSPLRHGFYSRSPIFLQAGELEIICDTIEQIASEFERRGTRIELLTQPHVPHDVIAAGKLIGFEREAEEAAESAGRFRTRCRYSGTKTAST